MGPWERGLDRIAREFLPRALAAVLPPTEHDADVHLLPELAFDVLLDPDESDEQTAERWAAAATKAIRPALASSATGGRRPRPRVPAPFRAPPPSAAPSCAPPAGGI